MPGNIFRIRYSFGFDSNSETILLCNRCARNWIITIVSKMIAQLIPQTFFCCNFPVKNYQINSRTNFCCTFYFVSSRTDLWNNRNSPVPKLPNWFWSEFSAVILRWQNCWINSQKQVLHPVFILVTIVIPRQLMCVIGAFTESTLWRRRITPNNSCQKALCNRCPV